MQIQPARQQEYKEWQQWAASNPSAWHAALYHRTTRWAECMEAEIANGAALADVADKCMLVANPDDKDTMSVAQYMGGMKFLLTFWVHADELMKWHNQKFLSVVEAAVANREGKVVNIAVVPHDGQEIGVIGTYYGFLRFLDRKAKFHVVDFSQKEQKIQ